MSKQIWSPEEVRRLLDLRASGYTCGDVATMLRRTEASVRLKLLAMGYSTERMAACTDALPSVSASPLLEKAAQAIEKEDRKRRDREEMEIAKSTVVEERIVEVLTAHWKQSPPNLSLSTISPRRAEPPECNDGCAIALLGDLHMGKVVDPLEVDVGQAYNPALAVVRSAYLLQQWMAALQRRPPAQLHLVLLGDLLEGALGHVVQDHLTSPVAYQFDLALSLLSQFMIHLSGSVPEMHVHAVTGNHGRMFRERKMPASGRWNNFDGLLYRSLDALVEHAKVPNIQFERSIQSRLRFQTKTHSVLAMHGDEVRGGAFAANGINREYMHASMRGYYTGQLPPDLLVMGDKHISAQLPLGVGQCVLNGSFVGTDAYSMGFPPSRPSQTMLTLTANQQETHIVHLDVLPEKISNPFRFKPDLERILNQYECYAILH